jgi:hypothetical protein
MTVKEARPIQLGGKDGINAPPGGDDKSNEVTGLACDGKTLFASYKARNLIGRFDTKTGAVIGTWEVPAPERLAVPVDEACGRWGSSRSVRGGLGWVTGWATASLPGSPCAPSSGSGWFAGGGGSGVVTVTVKAETTCFWTEAVRSGASTRESP